MFTDLWHRRPLRVIAAAATILGIALRAAGVIEFGEAAAAIAAVVISLETGQTLVTPVADPHDNQGRPLAPVDVPDDVRGIE